MKKRERKLDLHRETLCLLEAPDLAGADLARLAGNGPQTSERVACCVTATQGKVCCVTGPGLLE
jgi:hypothetical protein